MGLLVLERFAARARRLPQRARPRRVDHLAAGRAQAPPRSVRERQGRGAWVTWEGRGRNPTHEGLYREGLPVGKHLWYHDNGSRRATCEFRRGLPHGDWVLWNIDGETLETGRYADGRRDGAWTTWHDYADKEEHRKGGGAVRGRRRARPSAQVGAERRARRRGRARTAASASGAGPNADSTPIWSLVRLSSIASSCSPTTVPAPRDERAARGERSKCDESSWDCWCCRAWPATWR